MPAAGQMRAGPADPGLSTTDFTFTSHGTTLSGIISQPVDRQAAAQIVLVHGYGRTDVRGWNMYADLRSRFAGLGIASATWDKPGQGRSEGTFDIDQPVESSAEEVLDAVALLRSRRTPGSQRIGIWGISRAGWIAPIALSRDPAITFWISVSGVTAEDNYFYLLKSNLPYEGATAGEADRLMDEWRHGYRLLRSGAGYDEFSSATRNLRANAYIARMTGDLFTRRTYELRQSRLRAPGAPAEDAGTGMQIYVRDFDAMLSGLSVDVLAIFGERDLNVDWRKTRALYRETLGRNRKSSLEIRTFPGGNHNIDVCATGSLREMQAMAARAKCDGYYAAQVEWLRRRVVGRPR